jgi:hypothetical protein
VGGAQDSSRKIMTHCAFNVKFHRSTQFTFGSLMFAVREHPALASSSASGDSCLGLDPCVGLYIHTAKLVRGILVVTSILRPLAGASSPSSSASTPDQDSSDDYPEIGTSACKEPAEGGRLILMVAPNGDRSYNNSSRYPTIERTEVSDA